MLVSLVPEPISCIEHSVLNDSSESESELVIHPPASAEMSTIIDMTIRTIIPPDFKPVDCKFLIDLFACKEYKFHLYYCMQNVQAKNVKDFFFYLLHHYEGVYSESSEKTIALIACKLYILDQKLNRQVITELRTIREEINLTNQLSQSFQIHGREVSNRFVAQAMEINSADFGGKVGTMVLKRYNSLAEGDWGIVFLEATSITDKHLARSNGLVLSEKNLDRMLKEDFSKEADNVHTFP